MAEPAQAFVDRVVVDGTGPTSVGVAIWWAALCLISAVNIAAWIADFMKGPGRSARAPGEADVAPRRTAQLVLSALFVLGCAFRSAFPRGEGQRIVLYDGWISNAFLGRAVATVAELALVGQWTLVLMAYSRGIGSRFGVVVASLLLPLIAIAEGFSWYSALTTNFLGSVVEESIWAATAMLMTAALVQVWQRRDRARPRFGRRFLAAAIALNCAYVVFMCTVDVPMYARRWRADLQRGHRSLGWSEGARDSLSGWVVTRRWEDWRDEIPWMSLYFSAAVWISIALVRAPPLAREEEAARLVEPAGPLRA
jgi:hypothetical protein